MDIAAILRQIDAEIEKLKRIRTVIEELLPPAPRKKIEARRRKPVRQSEVVPEPRTIVTPTRLIVVPPTVKREYRPRYKLIALEPRALASVIPNKPVFVPKADVIAPPNLVINGRGVDPEALEAALRKNLLGTTS